jgi:hypothetical protein
MWYEINVSKDGNHLFATHERSLDNKYDADDLYTLFLSKFPAKEGYKLQMTKWEKIGHEINGD